MRSRNPVYPLPQGAFSVHINGDHNHASRYKSYSWMETGARQDLPLPDSWIGALEPSLYGTIIHAALTLLAY